MRNLNPPHNYILTLCHIDDIINSDKIKYQLDWGYIFMKKVILLSLGTVGVIGIIVIALICISMYKQSGFAVENQYYSIAKNESSLKKVCKDNELYKFIRKNSKSKIDFSDDQGSGDDFYYVASYGKKHPIIGVEGKFINSGSKITNIFKYHEEKVD